MTVGDEASFSRDQQKMRQLFSLQKIKFSEVICHPFRRVVFPSLSLSSFSPIASLSISTQSLPKQSPFYLTLSPNTNYLLPSQIFLSPQSQSIHFPIPIQQLPIYTPYPNPSLLTYGSNHHLITIHKTLDWIKKNW